MNAGNSDALKLMKVRFVQTLWALGGFSLVVNILMLTMPLYMLQIYDRVLSSKSTDTLLFLSVIAALALIVMGVLEVVRSLITARLATRFQTILGADALMASLQSKGASVGNVQPLRDLNTVSTMMASKSLFAILDLPFSPLFIGLLYFLHPSLFVLVLSGAVLLTFLAIINQVVTDGPAEISNQQSLRALKTAESFAGFSDSLRAMGMYPSSVRAWGEANAQSLVAQNQSTFRGAMLAGVSKIVRAGLQISVLGWGALLVLQGEMSAGMIFAASIVSGRGLQPIDQVIGSWKQYAVSWKAWKRLQLQLTSLDPHNTINTADRPAGNLSVADIVVLSASKRVSDALLKRIRFELPAGEALAIIGPSGAGKSTLARILVSALQSDAGTVRLDGEDIYNWSDADRCANIGYLSQDVQLLPGTIAQNIARMDGSFEIETVVEAAGKAGVHELIQSLPNGYQTRVGFDGISLSGGQKQRIALARAFYRNPVFIVLDEPNANLDEEGQRALLKALEKARQDKATVVIVTQRRKVLAQMDKILVLQDGSMDYWGSKEDFVARIKDRQQKSLAAIDRDASTKFRTGRRTVSPPPLVPEVEGVIDASFIPSFNKESVE